MKVLFAADTSFYYFGNDYPGDAAADAAMAELEGFRWPEQLQDKMERLRAFVADVAMEDVLEMVKTMKEMLRHDG